MTDLIACVSSGEGTWGHVQRLINEGQFGKVFLITNQFGAQKFSANKAVEFIIVDGEKPTGQLAEDIRIALQGKRLDFEVAVNMVSGTGKEHMALLSALLKLGVGIRLVVLTREGIVEL